MSSVDYTKRLLLTDFTVRSWSARKFDKTVTREVAQNHHVQETVGRYNKLLIEKGSVLTDIIKIAGLARTCHYKYTVPWSDRSLRAVPSATYIEYRSALEQHMRRFGSMVRDDLLPQYAEIVDKQRFRLGSLFNEQDYPTANEIEGKFEMKLSLLPFPNADDIRVNLAAEEIALITAGVKSDLEEAAKRAMDDVWQRLYTAVNHMVERLRDPTAKFHDTLVTNLKDLTHLLPALNITDDPKLTLMTDEVVNTLLKWQPDQLRHGPKLRADVAAQAQVIKDKLDDYFK